MHEFVVLAALFFIPIVILFCCFLLLLMFYLNYYFRQWPEAVALADERIQRIPFAYNFLNILPKCQQAQLLFSLFIQGIFLFFLSVFFIVICLQAYTVHIITLGFSDQVIV